MNVTAPPAAQTIDEAALQRIERRRAAQLRFNPCIPIWYARRMSQIAVRLSEEELRLLDAAVAEGAFRSRAEAVRAAIKLLEGELREARVADSYRAAYAEMALTADEAHVLDAASVLAGDALS